MKDLSKLYTRKQIKVLKHSLNKDFSVMILHGAKRSGKTVINNDIFLLELKRIKTIASKQGIAKPQYILIGHSLGTLQKNVLIELTNKYGLTFQMDKFNRFELFGVLVCCFGHGTIKDMERIRGMTSFGAYVNEGTTAVNEVFKEVLSRCSGEGARVICDTNPDHPEHWLKKDYIDNAGKGSICEFSFTLDENDFLTERYKANIKEITPTGMFYERDINGKWVSAEGVVYQDFDITKMLLQMEKIDITQIKTFIAGVDWGYEHKGAITVVGIDGFNNHILLEEHVAQHQEIDYWVDVAKKIKTKYGNIPFYCDSARPEHIDRFIREGLNGILANKSVLSGIEVVASLMKQGKFYVADTCNEYLKEVYNYAWDKKTGMPIKTSDDVQDSLRYAIYSNSKLKINFDYALSKDWGNYVD